MIIIETEKKRIADMRRCGSGASSKLHSERGASITFALLLFLVCAALSAVILVAATAASGRMAATTLSNRKTNVAEADRYYYAVMSAAELMRDTLCDGSFSTFKVAKNGGEPTRVYFDCPMNEVTYASIAQVIDKTLNPDTVAGADPDVPTAVGPSPVDPGLSKLMADMAGGSKTTFSYTLSSSALTSLPDTHIDGSVMGDVLEMNISSGKGSDYTGPGDGYKVLLRFKYDRRDVSPPAYVSEYYDITDSYEIDWTLSEMINAYDDN